MKRIRIYALAVAGIGSLAAACMFSITEGIHFKGDPAVDFGQPPHREGLYHPIGDGTGVWRPGTTYLIDDDREESDDQGELREANDARALAAVAKWETAGKLDKALVAYRDMLSRGRGEEGFLRERVEILSVGLAANDRAGLHAYLAKGKNLPQWLRTFAKYDELVSWPVSAQRELGLEQLAVDHPLAWTAEPALITVGRDWLAQRWPNPKVPEGRRVLNLLLTRYPHTRFRSNALGWLARADFVERKYRDALGKYWAQAQTSMSERARFRLYTSIMLCEQNLSRKGRVAYGYCLMLDATQEPSTRAYLLSHLDDLLSEFKPADAKEFWSCLRVSPRALSHYLDFRLDRTKVTPDLPALVNSAKIEGPYAPHIYARLAEASYHLHRYPQTEAFAERCGALQPSFDDRALVLYLSGSLAQKAGKAQRAASIYERVVRDYRKSYLAQGALENLALLYERAGRLGDALDVYLRLGYKYDVAYMLDMRMSPEQIRSYLVSHPHHELEDVIRYSLGIRYLRQHRFSLAEAALRAVPDWRRKAYIAHKDRIYVDDPASLRDPLITARELARLTTRFERAKGVNAKAIALDAIGNYYYDHHNLLLYNMRLWHGDRSVDIGFSWSDGSASKADEEAIREHHIEHECFSQALQTFKQVVRDYPNTKIAQHAAYRAACAAWRLSDFSPYWRWLSEVERLRPAAVNLMSRAAQGPDKKLAARAKKFAGVFYSESDAHGDYSGTVPKRRFQPYGD